MRPYERLSNTEFEELIGDLLGVEDGRRYERFRRGPDQGIDLRWVSGGTIDVIQCKHYLRSSFAQLRSAAGQEAKRLARLDRPPTRYRFATTRELTPANKDTLVEDLAPWLSGPEDVIGGGDVDALLDLHEEVERRHVKLWLAGGTALSALLNADVVNRSRSLLASIDRVLPLYVQTDALLRAHDKLSAEHVCLISGRPGIGKTTLAQMLVADAVKQGFEPVQVSNDIDEAWRLLSATTAQVFYYDDFLGTTTLGELTKNEDQRLVAFIAEIAKRPNALFVLTTREYILEQARELYESFDRAGVEARKFVLRIDDYDTLDRARILYNHVFHAAALPPQARDSLLENRNYRRIIDHELFNPRLIETIINGYGQDELAEGIDFVDYAVAILDDPEVLWRRVYDQHLSEREHVFLHALVSLPLPAQIDDLRTVFTVLGTELGSTSDEAAFIAALQVLDDSLVATELDGGESVVGFVNPGVEDFARSRLGGSARAFDAVLASATYFDQVQRLKTLFDPDGPDEEIGLSLLETGLRLLDSPGARWVPERDIPGLRLRRIGGTVERRLAFLLELLGGDDERFDTVSELAAARVAETVAGWHEGRGNPGAAGALAEALSRDEAPIDPPTDYVEALKDLMVATAVDLDDYRRLGRLYEGSPDAFIDGEIEAIGERFRSHAHDLLLYNVEVIQSEEEVQSYEVVADLLGVELDPGILEGAANEVAVASDRRAERDYERWHDEDGFEDPAEDSSGEIDLLFEGLRD